MEKIKERYDDRNAKPKSMSKEKDGVSKIKEHYDDRNGEKWISGAVGKHRGALHKKLGVPMGEKIPAKKLKEAEHSKNPKERKEAVLAETLKKMKKK